MIDAHVHFWNPADLEYFWLGSDSELHRTYLPEDLDTERQAIGVSGAVFVQASHDPQENAWALELAKRYSWLLGVVGWVNLERSDLAERLEPLARQSRFKGVRHLVHTEADERGLLRSSVAAGLEMLAEHGLTFDLVLRPEQFQHAPTRVWWRRIPDCNSCSITSVNRRARTSRGGREPLNVWPHSRTSRRKFLACLET